MKAVVQVSNKIYTAMGIKVGIGSIDIGNAAGANWTAQKDRSLFYSSRSGADLLETGSGASRNAKILPVCGKVSATNYCLKTASLGGSDASGFIEFRCYFGATVNYYVFSSCDPARTTRYISFRVVGGVIYCALKEATIAWTNLFQNTNAIAEGWHTVRVTSSGSAYSITVDGVNNPVNIASGTNNGKWFNLVLVAFRTNISIGAYVTSSPAYSTLGYIDYVNYNDVNKWVVTGKGKYVMDVIGTNTLTWTGTDHLAYNVGGGKTLMDGGYSLYRKAGELDEFVPYKNGVPYVNPLAGYTKIADFAGSAGTYNFAPALVDFDYAGTAHAALVAFNKADSTHHIATAGMSYYDAAAPYRWRQDELRDPKIYSDTYKNVGYKAFWLIKGTVLTGIVKDLTELLVYTKDQTGRKEWALAQYCTLQDLIVQTGGQPVYDGDNYLIWV